MGLLDIGLKIFVVLIFAGLAFEYLNGLQDISLERFDIEGIQGVKTDSFTIKGTLSIKNPGEADVPVDKIKYDVILEKTNEKISSGTITNTTIFGKQTTNVPFLHEVKWVPTLSLVKDLFIEDHVYAQVIGTIQINIPGLKDYQIPFSQRIDIKDYAQTAIPLQDGAIVDVLPVQEKNESGVSQAVPPIKGISDILPR